MSATVRHMAEVYCDGGYHFPLDLILTSGSKAEVKLKVEARGWLMTRDGKTYCPEHRDPQNRIRKD